MWRHMCAEFKPRLRVFVTLMAALTCVGADTVGPLAISTRTVGGPFQYNVVAGESVASLCARYGIDSREIASANQLKPRDEIAPGMSLRLDNRHIVPILDDEITLAINVPQRMLFLDAGDQIAGFPVALGRPDWQTPVGDFTVTVKEENPTWDVPGSIQDEMRREGRIVLREVPPGPTNPLGAFWLGLSLGSVGVHGTNAPLSIFRHVTHGCVRLHPDDIARLYPLVPLGARGRIIYQPILLAQTADGIFLETHPDVYRRMRADALSVVRESAAAAGITDAIDWAEAARVVRARRGIARSIGWAD